MSDTSQGEGWWMASDGKWYPPESHPAYRLPPPPPPPPPPAPPAGPMMYAPPEASAGVAPGPGPAAYPPAPVDEAAKSRRSAAHVVGAAAALMVLASFLPWVKVNFFVSITRSGVSGGDGWISVVLGGLLGVVAWRLVKGATKGARAPVVLAALLSLGALGLAIFEWVDIENASVDLGGSFGDEGGFVDDEIDFGSVVSKGAGIYALGIAGVMGVAGAIAYQRPPKTA